MASWMPLPTKPRSVNPLEKLTRNCYPGILCGIVILILTGLPGSLLPHVKPVVGLDKVAHMLMYAAFAFLCLWGYHEPYASKGQAYQKRALLLTVVIGTAYGGLTELMQERLVTSRTGDWFDWLADSIGALLGSYVFHLFFRQKK